MSKVSASLERAPQTAPTASIPVGASSAASATHRFGWALPLGLLFSVLFWIVAWHGEAAASMVGTWWRSDTFAHGLIIYPVSAWLIWRKRAELAVLPVRPCFWALIPLAAAGFAALLGEAAGVEAARQFGLVAMVALAVVAIMGTAIARAIAFPLAFTLLAVPVGEFLLPTLMQHTADFTVAALRLSGIPVYREGLFFTVPSGRWSVIEACSGLRYLIASVTLGLLYAYLSYTSLWRRVLFATAAIVVPIIANWLRAYMIVMIGHMSGMRLAIGIDHLIYGWLFFGVVMLLLFWIGSWWREDERKHRLERMASERAPVILTVPLIAVSLGVASIASAGVLYIDVLGESEAAAYRAVTVPRDAGGWMRTSSQLPRFTPHFVNARSTVHETYERGGRQVGVFIAYYARQNDSGELISFGNDLVGPANRGWRRVGEKKRGVESDFDVIESGLRSGRDELLTWHWYWAGGRWSARPEEVKLWQAIDRLTGRGDDAAVVVLYTAADLSPHDVAGSVLENFVSAMGPSIKAALEQARESASAQAASASVAETGK